MRLAGQDSRRGTFTQRHATLIDRNTGAEYTPLKNLSADQAPFWAYDSLLSEFAAMGFEYGYSVVREDALVCWEAQFGDFADGAQTIIDEFISSGEAKWGQRSAVTLLLPHGYEGQGPDHSSGRPERFLQLAAENNMTVAICSSPANYFHLLRRQGLSPVRRPLIAFTPKSLLRLKAAVSQLEEFTRGHSSRCSPITASSRRRCGECCCAAARSTTTSPRSAPKTHRSDIAILRVEQLYPLPVDDLRRRAGAVTRRRAGVGAGGTGEPGRLAVHRAQPARAPRRPSAAARLAPGVGLARGRLGQQCTRRSSAKSSPWPSDESCSSPGRPVGAVGHSRRRSYRRSRRRRHRRITG